MYVHAHVHALHMFHVHHLRSMPITSPRFLYFILKYIFTIFMDCFCLEGGFFFACGHFSLKMFYFSSQE